MLRKFLPLVVLAVLGSAQAQTWFAGVNGAILTIPGTFVLPSVGFQVGGRLSESLALRGTFDWYFSTTHPYDGDFSFVVGTDALYLYNLPDTPTTLYLGGGLDYIHLAGVGTLPLVHGTVGLEYRQGPIGFFGELRLYLIVPNLRAGLNIHF